MIQKNRNGDWVGQTDGQDRLLAALYGSAFGRLLLKPLTAPALSRLAGKFLSSKISCIFIKPFVRRNSIDLSQFEPAVYGSYNDFFSRKILPEKRPIDREDTHFISPCDSKLTVLPITKDGRFTLKHTEYTAASLLRDETLAAAYEGGTALVFRLTVDDYHRYCYIDSGRKGENRFIPGVLHTVNPVANDYFPVYKENSREYSILQSDNFGDIVMMEVGALLVGKIVNHHGEAEVIRGQEKGCFRFGGSTVVLLVKRDVLRIDEDILENSRVGIETVVRYGEKIGCAQEQ